MYAGKTYFEILKNNVFSGKGNAAVSHPARKGTAWAPFLLDVQETENPKGSIALPNPFFIFCGRTCSQCTGLPWGWTRGCLPESCPGCSSFRRCSGWHTPGRCIQRICWHDSSLVFPPFSVFGSSMDGFLRNIPPAKSIKAVLHNCEIC